MLQILHSKVHDGWAQEASEAPPFIESRPCRFVCRTTAWAIRRIHRFQVRERNVPVDRNNDLRLVWLKAFVLAEEFGKYAAVAKELGCDATGVGRYISKLEQWFGWTLVTNDVSVKLTHKGAAFLPVARQILETLDRTRDEIGRAPAQSETQSAKTDIKILGALEQKSWTKSKGRNPPRGDGNDASST